MTHFWKHSLLDLLTVGAFGAYCGAINGQLVHLTSGEPVGTRLAFGWVIGAATYSAWKLLFAVRNTVWPRGSAEACVHCGKPRSDGR